MFKARQNFILVAALISFGVLLSFGSAYLTQTLKNNALHQDALLITQQWLERLKSYEGNPEQFIVTHNNIAQHDGVVQISWHKNSGEQLARSFNIYAAKPNLPNNLVANIQDNEQTHNIISQHISSNEGQHYYSFVTVNDAKNAGYIQLVLDQTSSKRISSYISGRFFIGSLLLIVVAIFIPLWIVHERNKERVISEKRMHYMAHHDALTGLPNRIMYNQRLREALERCERNGTRLAVLCLDLDKFKDINDTLGHLFGDELLKLVAKRLQDATRSKDMVARLGGDEFVILSEDVKSEDNVILLARRIADSLAKPYTIDESTVISAGSIGIAMTPNDGMDPVALLKNADLALYRAKAEARGSFRFFEKSMDAELQLRRDLETDLREAVISGGFALFYQPQYDLQTSTLVGYEALVRWPHPTKGNISPAQFITLAEETGLINPMGEWILRRACLDAQIWPEHIKVAVNLSPAQFLKNDIASTVIRIVHETGINPERLELEITESLLLHNTDKIIEQLNRIREIGVTIAMDDFGTGYSSLSYISRFPFDKIKIDQSFIRQLDQDDGVAAIVSSIISLGRTLNITIIAEGVENEAQAKILRELGCKHVQGYLYGKPQPTSHSSFLMDVDARKHDGSDKTSDANHSTRVA